jgi:hypothetical protein
VIVMARARTTSELVVATEHAVVDDNGKETRLVRDHTVLKSTDKLVKAHPELFRPLAPRPEPPAA